MRLASGVMRVADVRNAGIRIGMGLDGGMNDTADVFNNMRAGVGLQRAVTLDSRVTPTVADVLRMATMGGAETLDQEDKIGSVTPGKGRPRSKTSRRRSSPDGHMPYILSRV